MAKEYWRGRGAERTSQPSTWSPSTRKIVERAVASGSKSKAATALKKEQAAAKTTTVPYKTGAPSKPSPAEPARPVATKAKLTGAEFLAKYGRREDKKVSPYLAPERGRVQPTKPPSLFRQTMPSTERGRAIIPAAKKVPAKAKELWESAETGLRARVTYPASEWLEKKGVTSEKFVEKYTEYRAKQIFPFKEIKQAKEYAKVEAEFIKGGAIGVKEKPLKTAVIAAVSFIAPPLLGYAGKVVAPIAAKFPAIASVTSKVAKYGLPTAYASVTGYRVYQEPQGARASKLGEIVTTEVAPMAVGGYAGAYFWPRAGGYLRTIGREEVPLGKITTKEVISGKETFPTAPPSQHKKLFLEKKYRLPGVKKPMGYHATPEKWKELVTTPGSSEIPGTYVSPRASIHFAKVGEKYSLYGDEFFPTTKKPTIMGIVPEKFVTKVPVKVTPTEAYPYKYKLPGETKQGIGYILKMKSEIEAVITPGTKLATLKLPKKYYTKIRGIRIPIETYSTGGAATTSASGLPTQTFSQLSSRYAIPTSYPISRSSSYLAPLAGAYGPSVTEGESYRQPPNYKAPTSVAYSSAPRAVSQPKYKSKPSRRAAPSPVSPISYKPKVSKKVMPEIVIPPIIVSPPTRYSYKPKQVKVPKYRPRKEYGYSPYLDRDYRPKDPFFASIRPTQLKVKKKLRLPTRPFDYDPSFIALSERTYGKAPKDAISIKLRPITPGFVKKMEKMFGRGL